MQFLYPEGATPLDPDATKGLIPALTNQDQLNAFEQVNISSAIEWAIKSRKLKTTLVSLEGIKVLHRRMFDQTWRWAGVFRQVELNFGVEWLLIPEQLKNLCDDVVYWNQEKIFSGQEIAIRFHHRLVQIHPFLNGNGRLSRLVADLFLLYRREKKLSWGREVDLGSHPAARREYIATLRDADKGDYRGLLRFAGVRGKE